MVPILINKKDVFELSYDLKIMVRNSNCFCTNIVGNQGFAGSTVAKNLPSIQETWVRSLGWEDPLEKEIATHSSILAWKFPWTEEPGGLQSMGSQRVGHNLASEHIFVPTQDLHHYMVYKVIRIFCHLFLTVTL